MGEAPMTSGEMDGLTIKPCNVSDILPWSQIRRGPRLRGKTLGVYCFAGQGNATGGKPTRGEDCDYEHWYK